MWVRLPPCPQMSKKKNKFEFSSDEQKQKYLNEIIGYFHDERGEEIGLIAAQKFLDFFLDKFGDEIYHKAVNDCQKIIKEKASDLDIELELLTT